MAISASEQMENNFLDSHRWQLLYFALLFGYQRATRSLKASASAKSEDIGPRQHRLF